MSASRRIDQWLLMANDICQLQLIPFENCADCMFARFRLQAATSRVNLAGIYNRLADEESTKVNYDQEEIEKLRHCAIQHLEVVEREEKGLYADDPTLYTWLYAGR